MISVDNSGHVDRYDDSVMKAVWRGALPSSGRHANQPQRYVPFPKDRKTAVDYLKRFDLSVRTGEPLGPHRLGADPEQVESVFYTLETRMREHNIALLRQVIVTDEFRLKKEMERVIAAIKSVCSSNEDRSFMQSMERVVEGATVVPVSSILGETIMIQVVCRNGERQTSADDVRLLFRNIGFTCPVLVCYSDSGYQTGETNKLLKDSLIETLGSRFAGWMPGQVLPEHYILIEDGASMHAAGDIEHSLFCLTSGLVVHHVAANSTHFSQLYDRIVYLIAKLLSIKELSIRIQAMTSQRPSNAIDRAGWCRRVMANCVLTMNSFDINDSSLQEERSSFMDAFLNNRDAEVEAMDSKIDDIFTIAERKKCDELFLLSAIAPSMLIALQPKYVVRSAIMVGLLPPGFQLGRDDDIAPGVWPDHVMKNPLVQLQKRRRENERNFMQHQETAIREVLSSIGVEEDQQSLSAAPRLSHAGERAALDAAPDAVWTAFKRSRGLENLSEEQSRTFQALVGDFHMFKHQVDRQESRTSALAGLVGFSSRTEAACEILLENEQHEMISGTLASLERAIKFGTSKFNAVIAKEDAAVRHLSLLERATNNSTKRHHFSNLEKCHRNATEECNMGRAYYDSVGQSLSKLQSMHNDDIEDARCDYFQLHGLHNCAREAMARIQDIVNRAVAINARVAEPAADDIVDGGGANEHDDNIEVGVAPGHLDDANADAAEVQNARVAVRRKCSKCGSLTHQSNNRLCPNFNSAQPPQLPDV
jgi:hypothetical protein